MLIWSLSTMNILTVLGIGFVVLWEIAFSHGQSSATGLTVVVPPRAEECFYHQVDEANKTMEIHFSVIATKGAEYDINFQLMDTAGRPVVTEFRKAISTVSLFIKESGTYKFCFDNTFSHISTKTLAFELNFDQKTNANWEKYNRSALVPEDKYDMQIEDIRKILQHVRIQLNEVQSIQDAYRTIEARGRSLSEDVFYLVNVVSVVSVGVMIGAGIAQISAIKGLLDNKTAFQMIFDMFKKYIG